MAKYVEIEQLKADIREAYKGKNEFMAEAICNVIDRRANSQAYIIEGQIGDRWFYVQKLYDIETLVKAVHKMGYVYGHGCIYSDVRVRVEQ